MEQTNYNSGVRSTRILKRSMKHRKILKMSMGQEEKSQSNVKNKKGEGAKNGNGASEKWKGAKVKKMKGPRSKGENCERSMEHRPP